MLLLVVVSLVLLRVTLILLRWSKLILVSQVGRVGSIYFVFFFKQSDHRSEEKKFKPRKKIQTGRITVLVSTESHATLLSIVWTRTQHGHGLKRSQRRYSVACEAVCLQTDLPPHTNHGL